MSQKQPLEEFDLDEIDLGNPNNKNNPKKAKTIWNQLFFGLETIFWIIVALIILLILF